MSKIIENLLRYHRSIDGCGSWCQYFDTLSCWSNSNICKREADALIKLIDEEHNKSLERLRIEEYNQEDSANNAKLDKEKW